MRTDRKECINNKGIIRNQTKGDYMITQLCGELEKCINNKNSVCPITKSDCYNPNGVSLIFRNTLQSPKFLEKKIILISDAPYNFPGSPNGYPNLNAQTVNEFIRLHFQQYGLERASARRGQNLPLSECVAKPSEIFDFIYLTFHPIFKNALKSQWAQEFVERIYWTSYCKRSYKQTEMPNSCVELLKKEIELLQPNLIISVMKKGSYPVIFRETYDNLELKQNKAKGIFKWTFNCGNSTTDMAIFPNPSGANAKMKGEFYNQKDYITNLIHGIHKRL